MIVDKTIYIKNMVCPRCIRVVKEDLENHGVKVNDVKLGFASISYNDEDISMNEISGILDKAGFELLQDKDQKIIEQVKIEIIHLLNQSENTKLNVNNSEYLAKKIGVNYGYLSRLFSNQVGITIEKYFIQQKIKKVKEFLKYEDMSTDEVSFRLGYSSVAHLSRQFKEVTGMTISEFKKENDLKVKRTT